MLIVRRNVIWIVLAAALAAGGAAAETQTYGAGVDLDEATPIGVIVADPEAWAGKQVRIEGTVVGVCTMRGCWMELESRDAQRLRVKVDDGVIVFPPAAEGRWAVAQGTVELIELTREQYTGWLRHLAEEQGRDFDEATVGEGPYRLVQIRGEGAEIVAD